MPSRAAPAVAVVLALAAAARADDTGIRREALVVGQTLERDVGYAIGAVCDEPDIVAPTMVTKGDTNVLRLTAKRVGTTLCRAGTDPNRASYVFEVTVRAKQSR